MITNETIPNGKTTNHSHLKQSFQTQNISDIEKTFNTPQTPDKPNPRRNPTKHGFKSLIRQTPKKPQHPPINHPYENYRRILRDSNRQFVPIGHVRSPRSS